MKPKETGLEFPLDPFQIIGWILTIYLILLYYLLILPLLDFSLQIGFGIPFTILITLLLTYGYKLTSSNPSDTTILEYRKTLASG